ncbi:MAG: Ribosomal RNA small subunit methyltransferase E [Chlamydiae bacterium]|nr:Ribosomal RNA small subunit methyltransferase E [Chlamydiota bacterium]
MPAERFFYPDKLESKKTIELQDKEFHHLVRVMRAQIGDIVEFVNGQGALAQGRIESIQKRSLQITLIEVKTFSPPQQKIILAQAIPRPQKLDDIIEKGTELGVTHFWLFPGKLSERKELSQSQQNRLRAISISALKQCGRYWLPQTEIKAPLKKWSSLEMPFYFGDIRAQAPLFHSVWKKNDHTGFFVGPESGFHDNEIEVLESLGACGVKLNPNILRTETAAILAAGLIAHWQL